MTRPDPISRLVAWAENMPGGAARLAAVFATTVMVRNLLEGIPGGLIFAPEAYLFHFPAAYVFPMLGIVAVLHLFSGYPVGRLMKLMVWAWTLTILPPLLDTVLGTGSAIGYFPLDRSNAVRFLLDFFNPSVTLPGTTAGIRIEAALGCILGGVFIGRTSRSIVRGVAGALLLAPLFLVFFGWPGMVNWALGGLFPYTRDIQNFMQWHSLTRPHLMNTVHMTIFIVDAWPVAGLSALLYLRSGASADWRRHFRIGAVPAASAFAGLAAVLPAASRAATVTFADAATISGAFLTSLLIASTIGAGSRIRAAAVGFALMTALAAGWPTFVAAALTAALAWTTPDRRLAGIVASPMILITAASPLFSSPSDISGLWPLLTASAAAALAAGAKRSLAWSALLLPAGALLLGAVPARPAQQLWFEETTDSFARSSRNSHAGVSAALLAGAGGSTVPLAQSAHLAGRIDQARWLWEMAEDDGDASEDMLQVGLNLAVLEGDREKLFDLLSSSGVDDAAVSRLFPAALASAASAGDTLMLGMMFRSCGSSARFMAAWSRAQLVLGDTASAVTFSRASLQAPDAGPAEYAFAAELAAMSGSDYMSIIDSGMQRFRASPELDAGCMRASLAAGDPSRAEESAGRILGSFPPAADALDACAVWLLECSLPDSALSVSERSLMLQYPPARASLEIAIACAEAAGRMSRADIHRAYLESWYPSGAALEPAPDAGPGR